VKLNVETIAAFSDELTGRVRLGVPDDYADRYLPEIMARFSRAYPAIELTVLCDETVNLLEAHQGQRPRSRDHHQLLRQHDGGKFPPGALAVGRPRTGTRRIWRAAAARARAHHLRVARAAVDCLEAIGRPYRVLYSSGNASAICAAVLSGLAVSVFPESGLRPGMRVLSGRGWIPRAAVLPHRLVRNPHERNSAGRCAGRARHLVARQPVGGGARGGVTRPSW
jgi:DNA-binding transcriptional LysR family regulator